MIKKFGKVLNHKEEIKEKLDWLFTGYNQMRKVVNDDRDSIKDLSRNIESHEGRLDGIDERLELICMRIGDYERERAERISKEAKEIDICESEPKDLHTSDASEIENCYEEYIAVVRSSNEAGMAPFLDEEIDYYDFRRKDSNNGGAWHEKWELDMLQISDLVITLK